MVHSAGIRYLQVDQDLNEKYLKYTKRDLLWHPPQKYAEAVMNEIADK